MKRTEVLGKFFCDFPFFLFAFLFFALTSDKEKLYNEQKKLPAKINFFVQLLQRVWNQGKMLSSSSASLKWAKRIKTSQKETRRFCHHVMSHFHDLICFTTEARIPQFRLFATGSQQIKTRRARWKYFFSHRRITFLYGRRGFERNETFFTLNLNKKWTSY